MGFYDAIRVGASGAAADYEVERSLRFHDGDSTYLNRTPSATGNRSTFTFSCWFKRSDFTSGHLFQTRADSNDSRQFGVQIRSPGNNDILRVLAQESGSTVMLLDTNQRFRDPSAWYHVVVAIDSTQATQSNRQKVYLNGEQITSFSTETQTSQNREFSVNQASKRILIGNQRPNSSSTLNNYWDGYIAEYYLIDGQQLTPSSFAETDSTTGEYKPIKYTGSFGTNGFYLNFSDNSGTTATTLGKDSSGNGHNFTPNNFSVSAGSGNDSVEDTPTNNFATFNQLLTDQRTDAVYKNGNTKVVTGSGAGTIGTSFAVDSGKWYAEFKCTAKTSVNMGVGIQTVKGYDGERQWNESQNGGFGIAYLGGDNEASGNKMTDGGGTSSYGASYVVDDIIGVALDVDNKTVNFYKNNSAQGTIDITTTKGDFYVMTVGHGQGGCTNTWEGNFGQRAFSYTPPTGFVAMNSQNLPDPSIKLPNKHFETLTYTGDSNTSRNITGLQFQPDLVWIKRRSASANHRILDSVRGSTKELYPNLTNAESTFTGISSFNSDGFTLATADSNYNLNTATYVAWNWNGGGSTASNSDGSITSSVRANTSAGFSIVSYTGNGSSGATIGHGLGVAPDVYIVKRRDGSNSWQVFHQALGNQKFLELHDSGAEQTSSNRWNNTSPTSTVFTVGDNSNVNSNGGTGIAYCFSQVAGYSKFGKYTGNGSTDGPFVYTGFRPAFVLIKRTDAAENWWLYDNKRNPYNPMTQILYADQNNAEISATGNNVSNEFLSNGIKFITTNANWNASGGTYIYMAFAETPFKYARAR